MKALTHIKNLVMGMAMGLIVSLALFIGYIL